jgi:peptidoglycan hydrolase CwlO-like protein
VESELESASDLLDQTKNKLNLTQEQRDQLRKQLVEKLEQLAQLNAKLDALLAEKGQLESDRAKLAKAAAKLADERAALLSRQQTLSDAKASLDTQNLSLKERLDALSSQLAEKVAALEEIERQRDRLKAQAESLDAIVASLKRKLEEMNIDLVDARDESESALAASSSKVEELEVKVAAGDKQAEEYLAQLRRAAAMLESLKAEKRQLETTLSTAEAEHQAELAAEARNNRELLGLKGPLKKVAIVFDASGSMREAGKDEGDRWAEAQEVLGVWLRNLNVQECVLVVFNSQVRTFPEDGTLADVRGEAGRPRREALLRQLKSVTPGGWTNTYDALRKAYEYEVDTILLFSDGAPSRAASGAYDAALAKQIFALCRQRQDVPINAIGLGNYFDADMSTFLRTVATITGGTFRGE